MSETDQNAELILRGGRIHTLDAASGTVEALAISGGVIVAAGADAKVMGLAGAATRVVDLEGRVAVPGFYDAHPHLDRMGLRDRSGVRIAHCRSVAEICEAIAQAAAHTPKGEWIVTLPMGAPPEDYVFEPGQLAEGRFPDRHDLDRAAPDHPVYIRSPWGWWTRLPLPSVANSRALALAGVTRETPAPHKVEIVRDASGEPTGVFLERNRAPILEYTLMGCVPKFTYEDRYQALRYAVRAASAVGITGAFEGHGVTPQIFDAYRRLEAAGELTVRMQLTLSAPTAAFGDAKISEMLDVWALTLAGRGRDIGTAGLLREEAVCLDVADPDAARIIARGYPYEQWAGHFYQSLPQERLIALGIEAARRGIRVCTLVCYELERVLQAFEAIDRVVPIRDKRWVAVHVTDASDDQLARMKTLGLVATVTPTFMWMAEDRFNLAKLGPRGTPIRRLLDAGIPVALSTDGVPHSMLFAVWEALARWDNDGKRQLGESGLSREEALRLSTVAGHYLTWDEGRRGPLAPGYAADIAVLDEDPLTCPLERIKSIGVARTFVGGREVYGPDADVAAF